MGQVTSREIRTVLRDLADPVIAEHSQRFFKTGKGQYGEGDKFLGIRMPVLRKKVREFRGTPVGEVMRLLRSPFHEERMTALLMLVDKFGRGDAAERKKIYEQYLKSTRYINNWDLVDSSAHHIVGAYLENRDKQPLYDLAVSDSLWERRIAMIATYFLIKKNEFEDALEISRLLKNDREDLIHKAVGWMLREIGKRSFATERAFLERHYRDLPRTMLRYAIERFPEQERKAYLRGEVGSRSP